MKKIETAKLIIGWDDGNFEDLTHTLPEHIIDALEIYFAELEQLRAEHDAGLREEPYRFETTQGETK